jgi:hypothetical protein
MTCLSLLAIIPNLLLFGALKKKRPYYAGLPAIPQAGKLPRLSRQRDSCLPLSLISRRYLVLWHIRIIVCLCCFGRKFALWRDLYYWESFGLA